MKEPLTEHDAQQKEAADIIAWLQPDALTLITTPQQGQQVEAMSAAAIAFYKEQDNYEGLIKAWRLYVASKIRTTELLIKERNMDVTWYDGIGYTKMQWSRRLKEYQLEQAKVNEYFDDRIAKGWIPSIADMLRFCSEDEPQSLDEVQAHEKALVNAARWLFTTERMQGMSQAKRLLIAQILDVYDE